MSPKRKIPSRKLPSRKFATRYGASKADKSNAGTSSEATSGDAPNSDGTSQPAKRPIQAQRPASAAKSSFPKPPPGKSRWPKRPAKKKSSAAQASAESPARSSRSSSTSSASGSAQSSGASQSSRSSYVSGSSGASESLQPTVPQYFWDMGFEAIPTQSELRQRYKELSLVLHPDAGGDKQAFVALRTNYESAQSHLATQK